MLVFVLDEFIVVYHEKSLKNDAALYLSKFVELPCFDEIGLRRVFSLQFFIFRKTL